MSLGCKHMSWSPRPDLLVHRWQLKGDVVRDELNSDYSGTNTHDVDDAAMRETDSDSGWHWVDLVHVHIESCRDQSNCGRAD
jgi:hypothetical protein